MNKLQSGPPRRSDSDKGRNQTAGFFNLRGCAGVAATDGTRRAHNCIPVQDILLLADSNYITWAPSIPCCLLLRPPVSRLGILQTLPSKTKRTSEMSFAESKCADTGTNDSGILPRSLRSVEPVCFPASHRALLHVGPRGSCGDCSYRRWNTT